MGEEEMETVIPFIDLGTERLEGNVNVVYPNQTACLECNPQLFNQKNKFIKYNNCYQMTIPSVPTRPEHCLIITIYKIFYET